MSMEEKFKGLSDQEVIESREQYGRNEIQEAPPETFLQKVVESLKDPMLILLMCIATFMLVLSLFGQAEIYEPVGTFVAVALVAFISAKTEMSSDAKYRELKESTKAESVKVHRNGVLTVIDIADIVVGDIVVLQSGDKIPADGVLIDGAISVNNSSLNGETEECKKKADASGSKMPTEVTGDTLVDEHSLFRGTTIYSGEGIMRVDRVGMATMMGEMAADMGDDEVDSPLKVKLTKLAGQISKFGYIGAIVIGIVYMVHFVIVAGSLSAYLATGGMNILKDIINALTIAIMIVVCAVPEGLPLMIAIVLASNTGKLLKANVLVRKAIGIETAGSINVLYSDKTGTITKGELEVVKFFTANGDLVEASEIKSKDNKVKSLLDISIGKNTGAMFDSNHKVIGGNATDQALLKFIGEETYLTLYSEYRVDNSQSFNSSNKFSQAYIESLGKTFYKGAPERLLAKAKKCLNEQGEVVDIDLNKVNDTIDELANKAMRVLAFGYSESSMNEDKINNDVVIIGLVGIRDEIRPEAKTAIADVKGAGIQVVMITGDRLETAVAIGRDANLLEGNVDVIRAEDITTDEEVLEKAKSMDTIAISSDAINKLSDNTIKSLLGKIRVIARALPKDKSRMVKLTQEMGLVVGISGDGVNDSPALKRADVGFSMGSGTESAKEASDLIIIDDNFLSIKNAIWYGRTIYENILKFVKFQLSINISAVLISAVLPFLGIESPLTVVHLLFVNLCMDSLGALLLGQEPALKEYMEALPRRRDESIVNKKMFIQFSIIGTYIFIVSLIWFFSGIFNRYFAMTDGSTSTAHLKTGFFALFMFTSIINGFNVRNNSINIFKAIKSNSNFIPVMCAMLAATFCVCQFGAILPIIGKMFNTTPLNMIQWLVVICTSVMVIPIDIVRKLVAEKIHK